MTAATLTKPALREVILDALEEAYSVRRGEIEECRDCARNPAGIADCHRADNDAAHEYDEARKQMERNPESAEVLAALCGSEGGEQ